jgi:predicted DNA repair protein MutK
LAGTSLLLLLDDITTLLDDIAGMSKVAAKKTSAVLGDDLAVNAQQLTGITAAREIPIVWAVAKGSFLNKLILVPSALLISAVLPALIIPLLICGALFLCFEGFESVWHFFHKQKHINKESQQETPPNNTPSSAADQSAIAQLEKDKVKVKGAIRTDFILSAEIIVITLGVVSSQTLITQLGVLATIAILITIGVYGLVAGIVKLDDLGLYLIQKTNTGLQKLGRGLLVFAPWLMKGLSVFGTLAMFMVGGGIITHDIVFFHHMSQVITDMVSNPLISSISSILFNMLVGIFFGGLLLMTITLYSKIKLR